MAQTLHGHIAKHLKQRAAQGQYKPHEAFFDDRVAWLYPAPEPSQQQGDENAAGRPVSATPSSREPPWWLVTGVGSGPAQQINDLAKGSRESKIQHPFRRMEWGMDP
jgi:hypothetical protein